MCFLGLARVCIETLVGIIWNVFLSFSLLNSMDYLSQGTDSQFTDRLFWSPLFKNELIPWRRNWFIPNDAGSPFQTGKWNLCFLQAKSYLLVQNLSTSLLYSSTLANAFLELRGVIISECSCKLSCRGRFFPYLCRDLMLEIWILKTAADCQVYVLSWC